MRRTGMPDHIGQRFLDDPEGGVVDCRRYRLKIIRLLANQRYFSAGSAQPVHQRVEPSKPRQWTAGVIRI
jgi:hypothetical protein